MVAVLLINSTPSFLFDEKDFIESRWDPIILFEKSSASTFEKPSSSGKQSFKIDLALDITLVNSKKSNDCPVPFIFYFIYDDLYRSLYVVNRVLGGMIVNISFKFAVRIGFKRVSQKRIIRK